MERSLVAVFKASMVPHAHAHRFRHTLATELLGNGASFEEVADILGNSPEIVRKHYAKWSPARSLRIDDPMARVHTGMEWTVKEAGENIQSPRRFEHKRKSWLYLIDSKARYLVPGGGVEPP